MRGLFRCSVVGCDSKTKSVNFMSDIKMYRFPQKSLKERRKLWKQAVLPPGGSITHASRVCNKHFISGRPSKDPFNPDYVPTVFDKSSKKTKSSRKVLAIPEDDSTSEKKAQVWTSLLNLQPIDSEASTSGLSVTKAANSDVSKPKAKPRPNILRKKRAKPASPAPKVSVESKVEDPLKLCVVKMEIEDDGYENNEEESIFANLLSSSSQKSQDNTSDISFDSSISIKTEPSEEILPTVFKSVPAIDETANNNSQQTVEAFFKNVAQTVMQLPPHLIEETKTKVSSLVYEMVIKAINEGCTNITQHEL